MTPNEEAFRNGMHGIDGEKKDELPCREFDDVLAIVGSQGKFQKNLLYFIVCPIVSLQPFITLNMVFLLFTPEHWCHVPGRDENTSLEMWKAYHIPTDYSRAPGPDGRHKLSHCAMYNSNHSIISCQNGWEYDTSEYPTGTFASAFDWVCEKGDYPTNAFTAYYSGNVVGTITFGHFADKYGRRPIFFLSIIITVAFRLASFFSAHWIELFYLFQFLVGTAFPIMFITVGQIVAEVCDKEYRGWLYSMTWMIWVAGMAALPLAVWICEEWYTIGLTTTLPGLLLFLYWKYLPESPRWLFSVGRLKEAAEILMNVAKCNEKEEHVSRAQLDVTLEKMYRLHRKSETATGVWSLFSRKRLAKNTLFLTFCWCINLLVYYGITLNTTQMSGNQFLNFFLLSLIEFPSSLCGAILVDRVGRRWTQVAFFSLCGFSCFASALVVQYFHFPIMEILSVIVAKFAITLTFLVVYLQGAEIFPTPLRSTGAGFASTVAAAAGIAGPLMVSLGTYEQSYPYWIMGVLSFVGMISAAFLPETLNQTLPETVDEANNFGKGNTFWSLSPQKVCDKPNSLPK